MAENVCKHVEVHESAAEQERALSALMGVVEKDDQDADADKRSQEI